MLKSAAYIAWSVLIKIAEVDPQIREHIHRVARRAKWRRLPTDAELEAMFPKDWSKTNPSWQSRLENSPYMKEMQSEPVRPKSPPPPPSGQHSQPSSTYSQQKARAWGPPPPSDTAEDRARRARERAKRDAEWARREAENKRWEAEYAERVRERNARDAERKRQEAERVRREAAEAKQREQAFRREEAEVRARTQRSARDVGRRFEKTVAASKWAPVALGVGAAGALGYGLYEYFKNRRPKQPGVPHAAQ